jgi:hypothetical protein
MLPPLTYTPEPLIAPAIHKPWAKSPFALLPRSSRKVLATDTIHDSVLKRWQQDAGYRPEAMTGVAAQIDQLRREL